MTTRSKKIIYLVDFLRTVQAGTEKQLGYLLSNVPQNNYAVSLISLQDSPFLKDEAPSAFPNVRFITLGAKPDLSKSLRSLVKLFFILRSEKPDLLHTFFPASNSYGIIIAKLAGVRALVSSRRDMGFNLSERDILFLKIANRFISCVIANSVNVRNRAMELESLPINKMVVIYNGIDVDAGIRAERSQPKECIVGIVSNLNRPVKRVDLFIKAAAIVNKSMPQARFWIIGDGDLRPGLEKLASELSIKNKVMFLGRRRDIETLLPQLSVGVICSDSEGLSNVILEYMSAGLPAVATEVGGNTELINHGETGFLVPPNDEKALAKAVEALLLDPVGALKMGGKGYEFVDAQFSVKMMLKETMNLYENVIRPR